MILTLLVVYTCPPSVLRTGVLRSDFTLALGPNRGTDPASKNEGLGTERGTTVCVSCRYLQVPRCHPCACKFF